MARNVNLWISNWHWTGSDIPCPQAEVDVRIRWSKNDGTPSSWEGIVTFPNDLQDVPVAWLKNELEDLMIRAARVKLGIDEVE